jgi:hypothetical protein
MSWNRGAIAGLLIVAGVIGMAVAEEEVPEFSPATFPENEQALVHKLRFPDVQGEVNVTIKCDSHIDMSGRFGDWTFCFPGGTRFLGYQKAVFGAVPKARMIPAQVRGRAVSVWFQYSVNFQRSAAGESIRVFPNQLLDTQEYGLDYIGPQRHEPNEYDYNCPSAQGIWVSMTVDEHGIPGELAALDGRESECTTSALHWAGVGRYIPAFSNSRPVKARAHVMFFTPSDFIPLR